VLRRNWSEHRIYFHDESGSLVGIPARWTSAEAPDPWVVVAAGRSHFRLDDLIRLRGLIDDIQAREIARRATRRRGRRRGR